MTSLPPGGRKRGTSARRASGVEGLCLGGILTVAALLLTVHAGADVPQAFERTDAPVQDAFWYLEAAATRAEGREPQRTGVYEPWPWIAIARVWLQATGASLRSAGLLGGLVALVTIALTWRIVRARLGPGAGLGAAAALTALPLFVVLGRTTLIYGPATLALVLAAAVWLGAGRLRGPARHALEASAWGVALGAVIVVRPPAGALCGGLLCAHLVRAERPARAALALGAALGLTLLVVWAIDPGHVVEHTITRLGRYTALVGSGAPGSQPAAGSAEPLVEALARRALRLGGEPHDGAGSGFLPVAPGTTLLAALGLLLALARRRELRPGAREALALFAGWGLCFALAAVVIDYRPLRYFVVIAPPIAAFAGFALAALARPGPGARLGPWGVALTALWGAVVLPHVVELASDGAPLSARGLAIVAPCGAALALALVRATGAIARASERTRHAWVAVVVVVTLGADLRLTLGMLAAPRTDALLGNELAGRILGPGARVLGPMAPIVCIGHGLERASAPWIDTRAEQLPATLDGLRQATHVALSIEQAYSTGFAPRLRAAGLDLRLIAVLPIRHGRWAAEVVLYRIEDGRPYEPTGYERGETITDPDLLLAWVRARGFEGEVEAANAAIDAALRANPRMLPVAPILREAALEHP